jgi:anti-sigma B factor antagonist
VLEGEEVVFFLEHDRHDDHLVIRVTGELDVATAPELHAAVVACGDVPLVVVDLSPCTFVDSTGCRVLVVSAREVPGPARVVVVCPEANQDVYRILDFVQLSTALKIYDRPDDALADARG